MMRWESDILKRKIPVWWERPSEVHIGTSESENEMKDTNPAREVNAKGKDDILGESTNNIRLECQEW
jgi:hypothetical protein